MIPFGQETRDKPLTIYFVRHGQCEGQGLNTIPDPPLTHLGSKQAEHVAKRFSDQQLDHIYFSFAARARATARPILAFHGDTPCTETAELLEVSKEHFLGNPENLDIETRCRLEREGDMMVRFINRLRHNHEKGGNVLVVAHGNIILCLIALLGGKKPYQSALLAIDNTSVSIAHYWLASGITIVKKSNCTSHLKPNEVTA